MQPWLNFGVKSIHSEWVHFLLLLISAEPNSFLVHSQGLNSPSWRLLKNAMGAESHSPRRSLNVCNHKGPHRESVSLSGWVPERKWAHLIYSCMFDKKINSIIHIYIIPTERAKNFWWNKESSLGIVCFSPLLTWSMGVSWRWAPVSCLLNLFFLILPHSVHVHEFSKSSLFLCSLFSLK